MAWSVGDKHFRLSLELGDAEGLCVVGPSGCGKSTWFRSWVGAHPWTGNIRLGSQQWTSPDENPFVVGWAPQSVLCEPRQSVESFLADGLKYRSKFRRWSSTMMSEASRPWLDAFDLNELDPRSPLSRLSGGQKQRLNVIRAAIGQPEILLLDEPFSGVDVLLRHRLWEFVVGKCRDWKTPWIVISHDPSELQRYCSWELNFGSSKDGLLECQRLGF
jgi:ABC-type multidrug transport system ATPase subunit